MEPDAINPQEAVCKIGFFGKKRVETCFDDTGKAVFAKVTDLDQEVKGDCNIASVIDQTLLKPSTTREQIEKFCKEGIAHQFGTLCVNPYWVSFCCQLVKGTGIKIGSSIGFPLGASTTATKVFETIDSIQNGAQEIDMVMNVGALKSGDYTVVLNDIREVVRAAHDRGVLVKVILENCLLTEDEKVIACLLAKQAQVDFVKTSTGFSSGGATVEDVALMRRVVGPDIGVKAAGGIRSYKDVYALKQAGGTRFGTSNGVAIVAEAMAQEG